MLKHTQFTAAVTALISGVLFGMGLTIAEMVNPQKVLGFLDVTRDWDPSLALVMAAALLIGIPVFQWQKKLKKPLCDVSFSMPTKTQVDKSLLAGAVLFGTGWGLAGLCPGPVIASLWTGSENLFWFAIPMFAGIALGNKITS